MAQPVGYTREQDFTAYQDFNAEGSEINRELDNITTTTNEIRVNLDIIQKDDGQLSNDSVGNDQLKDEVVTTLAAVTTTAAANANASAISAYDSAEDASQSAVDAASHASSAAQMYDNFDDRYLGSKAIAPSLDNDGDPLVNGAIFYDSEIKNLMVYTSNGWVKSLASGISTMHKFRYTATAGQINITGIDDAGVDSLELHTGIEIVTLNGIFMEAGTDYTAFSDTIVMNEALSVGDELNIYAFGNFDLSNHYNKPQADARFASNSLVSSLDASVQAALATIGNTAQIYVTATSVTDGTNTFPQYAPPTYTGDISISTSGVTAVLNDVIDTQHIADNAVTVAQILNSSINEDKIAANAVNTSHVSAGSITANEILAGEIGANHIAANAITAGQIAAGTITSTEIQANTIGAGQIAANSITASQIASNTITSDQIAANSITSGTLTITGTGAITPATIGAGTDSDVTTAQSSADAAQSTANTAVTDAASAQTTANQGVTDAAAAQTAANLATLPSEVAAAVNNNQTLINGSKIVTGTIGASLLVISGTNAVSPSTIGASTQADLNTTNVNVTTAQSTADGASSSATTAQNTANTAASDASSALATIANVAANAVTPSQVAAAVNNNTTTINGSKITAGSLGVSHLIVSGTNALTSSAIGAASQTDLNSTNSNVTTAQSDATSAANTANTANSTANTANTNANTAISDAASAQTTANSASSTAASALTAADAATLPDEVANAVNNNTTTINGGMITSASVDTAQLSASAVTANKINVNDQLDINAASGSFTFKKTTYSDYSTSGVFVGNRSGSNIPVFLAGNNTSYIQVDDAGVTIVGADFADSTTISTPALPNSPVEYNSAGVYYFPISSAYATLTFKLSGAGGGGAGARSGGSGETNGLSGGTTTIQILNADESSTIATYTASGGAGGVVGGGSPTGGSFDPVNPNDSLFIGTGGTGVSNPSSNDSHNGTAASGQSSGGGGGAHDSYWGSDDVGNGGAVGSYSTPSAYSVTNSTYFVKVTIAEGGNGGTGTASGGKGSDGAVRISVTLV